ncbi:MAG: tetratricopeptide repeat protein [Bacteroidia bacterium]|nr:tetratricopeptide repeat protein [Bacteroidia bacterium]
MIINGIIYSQNSDRTGVNRKIDSLSNILKTAKHDITRINCYLETGYYYENTDINKALEYYNMAENLAQKNIPGFSDALKKDSAFYKIIKSNKAIVPFLYLAEKSLRYKGIIYYYSGNFTMAMIKYHESLKISEQLENKIEISKCLTNIGLILFDQGNYKQALENFQKNLEMNRAIQDKSGIGSCLNIIGNIYVKQKNYASALNYYEESIKINESLHDKSQISASYSNIGVIYRNLKDYTKAILYYRKALEIDKELGDNNGISICLDNIGYVYCLMKDYNKAIEYSLKSLEIAEKIGAKENIRYAYGKLSEYYAFLKDHRKAYEYLLKYSAIKDSIYNTESSRQLHEMEVKYQTEKKQQEITILNKDKELQKTEIARKEAETKKQRIIILFVVCGLILVVVFSVFLFRLYLQKKKANVIIARKNESLEIAYEEIKQQKEEITAQRDEIESQRNEIIIQRDLVTHQKEEIEIIHEELTDSIHYAERIQKAVLPDLKEILRPKFQASSPKTQDPLEFWAWNSCLPAGKVEFEAFILFRPKDIVSGDFYFVEQRRNWLLVAVADCTGHGVPGAFMSMLGISFLQEIIAKDEIQTASHVLDELRNYIIYSLQQKGVPGEQKDGMDMAFVAINLSPQTTQVLPGSEPSETCEVFSVQYAGANNPVYIVETGHVPSLREIRPDKMPVAIHENMQPFTNHVINLQKGNTIYLMSDGYADQFGGPKGKKFYEKTLKEMLLVNSNLSMEEQKEILDKTLEKWKNVYGEKYEQTDDITVLGIKV